MVLIKVWMIIVKLIKSRFRSFFADKEFQISPFFKISYFRFKKPYIIKISVTQIKIWEYEVQLHFFKYLPPSKSSSRSKSLNENVFNNIFSIPSFNFNFEASVSNQTTFLSYFFFFLLISFLFEKAMKL